jgi:RND family efflux transporter MFP subunit
MNDIHQKIECEDLPLKEGPDLQPDESEQDRVIGAPSKTPTKGGSRFGRWLFGIGALLLLVGGLAFGTWRYNAQQRQVAATAEAQRNSVPSLRVAAVRASPDKLMVSLPGTTAAFAMANMYARASGYIDKRNVDIGDHVKEGDLLVEITAPELDHQIAQAEAQLALNEHTLRQNQASRELAHVTNTRDSQLVKQGWATLQQGDTDRLTLQAQEAAVSVAEANIAAQQALIRVLRQQKAYQRVVAPFDGVITQRAIDIGGLAQAGSTFLFTVMQTNVIRTYVYVPQDAAFGVAPGVDAVIRVPEIPDRTFPGKVTRTADALQPGTRTLLTEIDVPNPDGALSAGIYCTVELQIPRKTPSLIISADAVIFNQAGTQVAVLEDGTAHIRKISIARDLGREVEVRDGVKPGDRVILNPPIELVDGSKVEPRASPAVANR